MNLIGILLEMKNKKYPCRGPENLAVYSIWLLANFKRAFPFK